MLGRAVKQGVVKEEKSSQNNLAKTLFPSSSPAANGKIDEQFKKARSSQSIAAFTGVLNRENPSSILHGKSTNYRPPIKKRYDSSTPSTTGHASIFSREDSFRDSPDTVFSVADTNVGVMSSAIPQNAVVFDENDFDDDDDIDLDMDYELPPPKPVQVPAKAAPIPNISRYAYNPPATKTVNSGIFKTPQHKSQACPPSSAQTWSPSSPSHHRTPPGAIARREREASSRESVIDLTQDTAPKAGKRRKLPWMGDEDEAEQERSKRVKKEEVVEDENNAVKMENGPRLETADRRGESNLKREDSTPAPRENQRIWDLTASGFKDQRKVYREEHVKAKRDQDLASEAMKSSSTQKAAPIQLSTEQSRVLELVLNGGKSVFFTGSAGTGKSVLMRAIIDKLRKKYMREPDRVAVTASTGLAACNIGGVTLHSYGGIGLGKEDVPTLVKKIKRNPKAKNRWLRTKILIVDEISMVDGDLFDKLEGIARALRNNGRPFGGIQLVITGDFFQLPPVPDFDKKDRGVKFAFDAATWGTAIHHTIGLTEVFRQKDPVFANMLNEMRLGKISPTTIDTFKKLSRPITFEDSLDATELFPTRNEVENSNSFRMRALHGKAHLYPAKDTGTMEAHQRDKLLSNMMAPKFMELKKGAQVMLIKNIDETLVNGSLGKVVAFMSTKTFEIYNNHESALDDTIPDEELDEDAYQARQKIRSVKGDTSELMPLVQFSIADGTKRSLLVQPEEWKVELPNGEVVASRSQLPLILAWALSIHKAQGQTLERVKIDLKKIFEKGQAYVALSRATNQAGLEVKNFDKSKVMAHPRVAQFYNSLYSINKALEHPKVAVAQPLKKTAQDTKDRHPISITGSKRKAFEIDDDELEAMAAYG